jgi:hypothetical protein
MNSKRPVRTQVTLRIPPEMLDDMDREADRLGMSRGAYLIHLHEKVGKPLLDAAEAAKVVRNKKERAL